jgi:transposase-like protein
MHRTSRKVNNHLEVDHRGIKPWYRSMSGFKQWSTAVRFTPTLALPHLRGRVAAVPISRGLI